MAINTTTLQKTLNELYKKQTENIAKEISYEIDKKIFNQMKQIIDNSDIKIKVPKVKHISMGAQVESGSEKYIKYGGVDISPLFLKPLPKTNPATNPLKDEPAKKYVEIQIDTPKLSEEQIQELMRIIKETNLGEGIEVTYEKTEEPEKTRVQLIEMDDD